MYSGKWFVTHICEWINSLKSREANERVCVCAYLSNVYMIPIGWCCLFKADECHLADCVFTSHTLTCDGSLAFQWPLTHGQLFKDQGSSFFFFSLSWCISRVICWLSATVWEVLTKRSERNIYVGVLSRKAPNLQRLLFYSSLWFRVMFI